MHLAHEVAVDDRVSERLGAQQRRNLAAHRRLADTGSACDEQYVRVVHEGSVPAAATSRDPFSYPVSEPAPPSPFVSPCR
ncbi:hypothetical protein [Streptomyces sp. NPDC017260]|uniref:hypothetical protein n=1 Tax=unclassified Streptomyces TaxID=2593676 RepID=UPI0037AFFFEF